MFPLWSQPKEASAKAVAKELESVLGLPAKDAEAIVHDREEKGRFSAFVDRL